MLNRAVARLALFEKAADYEAFERVLAEAMDRLPTRLLGYVVMPNHWHLVLRPRQDCELTDFVRWLTHTHVMRWHAHFQTAGRLAEARQPAAVRTSVQRGSPFGTTQWQIRTARRLGLEWTMRPRGRSRKKKDS